MSERHSYKALIMVLFHAPIFLMLKGYTTMKTYISVYQSEHKCFMCNHIVSNNEKYHNDAVCPYCGIQNGTFGILKTYYNSYKLYKQGKWWQFWKEIKKEYR